MTQREKKLALAFAAVIVFMVGKNFVNSWFLEPVREREAKIETNQTSLDQQMVAKAALDAAEFQMQVATLRGLPFDEDTAQRIYLEWINDLVNVYGFQSADVTAQPNSSRTKHFFSVQVGVKATAKYDQLCRFLRTFENTALVQRMFKLKLKCDEHSGNPPISVEFTAEALAFPDSQYRNTVFPRIELSQTLEPDGTVLAPGKAEGFPTDVPFLVRCNRELIQVTAVKDGRWTLSRGFDQTTPAQHAAGTDLELLRLRSDSKKISNAELEQIVAGNFFLKPKPPYEPRLLPIGDPDTGLTFNRMETYSFQLQAVDFPPDAPPQRFGMRFDSPPGLSLDEKTGAVTYIPEDPPAAAGPYFVTFDVYGSEDATNPLASKDAILTLTEPNLPPSLAPIEDQIALTGNELFFRLEATDPDSPQLEFAIDGELPEGAVLDPLTGEFRWTPPEDATPEEFEFVARVTDDGDPPQSATQPFKLSLQEDLTRETYLVGIDTLNGRPEATLYNRGENISTILIKDFPFQASGIKGKVRAIEPEFVIWESGDDFWRLEIGENLHSRRKDTSPISEALRQADAANQPPLVAPRPPAETTAVAGPN